MNQRTPVPPIVQAYWDACKFGPPKCCHTCDEYAGDGKCLKHGVRPPDDFTVTIDVCPDWIAEVPF